MKGQTNAEFLDDIKRLQGIQKAIPSSLQRMY